MKETDSTISFFNVQTNPYMTENPDIPSAKLGIHTLWENKAFIITALLIALIFLVSFLSVVFASESEAEKTLPGISHANAQTIALMRPTTFQNSIAFGGASFNTIDNALIANRSVLDNLDGSFTDRTGHSTNIYIVRQGDTISEIAESFGVSQNTIRWANDLGKQNLKVGQKLTILPVTGIIHTIKKGDSVSEIAKKYGGDTDEILAYNKLSEDELTVGEDITIPGGAIKSTTAPKTITSGNRTSGAVTVTGTTLRTVRSPSGLLEVPTGITYTWQNGVRTSKLRGTGGPTYTNYYIRPVQGWGKSRGLHGFNSVDFAAPQGTPILASASGKVIISKKSAWNGGYGKYVAIEHSNGTQTLYAHQSSVIVSKGQNVVQGQVIGYVGTTGNSSGNHLHFEVRGAKNPF